MQNRNHRSEHPLAVHIRECGFYLLQQVKTEFVVRLILGQCQGLLYNECVRLAELAVCHRAVAEHQYDQLRATTRWGYRLTVPFRVILAGPPNVGKSSLMNALVGFDRTLTDSMPGTTRDTVSHPLVYNGWEFLLWDTAGIRQTTDPIEQEGCRRTAAILQTADAVLWIHDNTYRETVTEVAANLEGTCVHIHVLNKIDLLCTARVEDFRQRLEAARNATQNSIKQETPPSCIVSVSAKTGEGVSNVLETLYHSLLPQPPSLRIPCLFSPQLELTPFDRLLQWF